MRVLVTGSSGWLGQHLVPALRAIGHETIGLDIAPGTYTDVQGNLADRSLCERVFGDHDIEAVIHGAALHKPDIVRYPQQAFIDVNVTGTLNLLELASARPGTRFVFTSTTSLMISQAIRDERASAAVWLDETAGPLEPRNIYGVSKLAAEGLCRQHHLTRGLPVIILRTSRFFPEEDDTHIKPSGPNLKANELLYRRATTSDMVRAHLAALERAEDVGFGLYIVSGPTPFQREDCVALKNDAAAVITRYYPQAAELYEQVGWVLPQSIGRVYDSHHISRELGFKYETGFADVLAALEHGTQLPVDYDPSYTSPMVTHGVAP